MANQGKGISQARERLNKIDEIWQMINDANTGIVKKKLVATFCLKYGSKRRTCLEYIGLLIDADKIVERDGILY